jgi:hypothetical protein
MSATKPLPELPLIEDFNLLLEVVTHKDLKPTSPNESREWGGNERLAELGAQVLSSVVTIHFFAQRPVVRAEEMRVKFNLFRDHLTS